MRPAKPTLRDVALLAGVSTKTVSRVVNEEPGVAPATRQSVQAVVERLQFTPDPVARALRSRS